ncbi:MAG: sulfoxide reductase heme-binding subunit YedZ [Gammaproteobacteria bacterium]|nr:sulfoxide reductase heme-binding subunit YedZ [Gammaproteobacteria bacterium]MYF01699.1 sulfoxide reductase heme-binding subunit YedZ [Gammaproteobacteria bacterium]MYI76544.1 sulfoxide reductase heme-binding subunit YedZ [Gammaproteobacteria bacterium]
MARPRLSFLATKPAKWVVGLLLAIPLLLLLNDVRIELFDPGARLGPNPGDVLVDRLGTWSIRFLYLTLLVSSISRIFKIPVLVQHRRTCGLFAFTYVVLHFTAYLSAILGFDFNTLLGDFSKRPYIIFGMIALLLLIPLAITSTRGWRKRLKLNWKRLHRLIYLIAVLALIHLWMQERSTYTDTVIYGSILVLLFVERIVHALRQRLARANAASAAS